MRISWVALLLLAVPARAENAPDHLQCYRVGKAPALKKFFGSFEVEAGCTISKARFLCVPTRETVAHVDVEQVLSIRGRPLTARYLCHRVKCGRSPPRDHELTDQFGSRVLETRRARFLCLPVGTQPPDRPGANPVRCYKAKDPLRLHGSVDLDSSLFGPVRGCEVRKTRLFCDGAGLDDDRVCYSIACPRGLPARDEVAACIGGKTRPQLLCGPAIAGPLATTTTATISTVTTTTTALVTTTTPFATTTTLPVDATFACQRAIESGGMEYVEQLLQAIEGCAAPGQTVALRECLSSPPVRLDLGPTRDQWMATVGQACGVTSLRHDLGYLETCAAPPSACTSTIGDSSSLIECLACRIDEILAEVGVALFADQPVTGECHRALGTSGVHALRAILQQLHSCLQQPEATSIAACFTSDLTPWRGDAETACAGMDPFSAPGYAPLCAGIEPVRPPACAGTAPPCAFPRTAVLSVPSEGNDLLDCLACRLEEAALAVGRTLHGAELCCTSEGCGTILSRAACHRVGGAPVHYELGSVDFGNIASPHGIAVGADGTVYVADTGNDRIVARSSAGSVRVVGPTPGAPYGVAVDHGGNVYAALRRANQVVRVGSDGTWTPVAGAGRAEHSGDDGPAACAETAAPNGVAVDDEGNVYVTESRVIAAYLYDVPLATGEHVRVVDPAGTMHTFAGAGPYGSGGVGGPALAAQLGAPYQVATTADGALLIGEVGLQRALRVGSEGTLTALAGRPLLITIEGVGAFSGDGGRAVAARLYGVEGLGMDGVGNTFLADMRNSRIRLVDSLGSIITIAGTGASSDGPAASDGTAGALANAGCPGALAVGPDDRVYYTDLRTSRVRTLVRVPY